MSKPDLSKLTQLELLDLIQDIHRELENINNRNKQIVTIISIEKEGFYYFLSEIKAIKWLNTCLGYEIDLQNKISIYKGYLDENNLKICQDYISNID